MTIWTIHPQIEMSYWICHWQEMSLKQKLIKCLSAKHWTFQPRDWVSKSLLLHHSKNCLWQLLFENGIIRASAAKVKSVGSCNYEQKTSPPPPDHPTAAMAAPTPFLKVAAPKYRAACVQMNLNQCDVTEAKRKSLRGESSKLKSSAVEVERENEDRKQDKL